MHDPWEVRDAMIAALPVDVSGLSFDKAVFYWSPSHLKALHRDANLVVGTRGVGKTVWATMLCLPGALGTLAAVEPSLKGVTARAGFGEALAPDTYPGLHVFRELMERGVDPEDIWRAVVLRGLRGLYSQEVPVGSWGETVDWVVLNREEGARVFHAANVALSERGEVRMFVFDALDRAARDWESMDEILRGLLRLVLTLRSLPAMRTKVFVREDQMTRAVTSFPDASKVTATSVELSWLPHDLHGLLWQYLCNGPEESGRVLRGVFASRQAHPLVEHDGHYLLPMAARRAGPEQRALFEVLAGTAMGTGHRRGVPYTWIVSHLADAQRRTAPRSFLAAIRAAAEDTKERYPAHDHPLHYESIKRGVQRASQLRVNELSEDYPWVRTAMAPLSGCSVPCDFETIASRWRGHFPKGLPTPEGGALPPRHGESWEGVRDDLARIGIFDIMLDGRINMPDLYRVGFRLGRRGGVKPLRSE